MTTYYNENDAYAAQWLRNLVGAGLLPPGDVDDRSICDVDADDLRNYTQLHFFAGIGGWPLALRMAEWPDDRPVWTGSCPCQPFSVAGAGGGFADARHLWPVWFRLIAKCRPAVLFGEQVASPAALTWLDVVQDDLEGAGYAVGASDLCAASCGAPHIRQRLFWVADSSDQRWSGRQGHSKRSQHDRPTSERKESVDGPICFSETSAVALADADRGQRYRIADGQGRLADGSPSGRQQGDGESSSNSSVDPWSEGVWVDCIDGKRRLIESGLQPLASGIPSRVGKLRAYGNSLVPQVATTFIRAAMPSL